MEKTATLALVGGDVRQTYLAQLLLDAGHTVQTYALERSPIAGCKALYDLRQGLKETDAVILPMPLLGTGETLNAPLSNAPHNAYHILDAIPSGTLTLGGSISFAIHARAVQNELTMVDYLAREELAIRNAVPSCEGAIQIAMEHTAHTIADARCLVIGYGRIGRTLAQKLKALGAYVTVSARSSADFASIETNGYGCMHTEKLTNKLSDFDLIFNSVPAPVLTAQALAGLRSPCLLIDLASMPGGITQDASMPEGCTLIHALSLPGKVAPFSAAKALCSTILSVLEEEDII